LIFLFPLRFKLDEMAEQVPFLRLKCENHSNGLVSKFFPLLQRKSFVDVSLAADGGILKAHRLVLSSSSEYFEVKNGITLSNQ